MKKKIILGLILIMVVSMYRATTLAKYVINKHKDVTIYVNTSYDQNKNETKKLSE